MNDPTIGALRELLSRRAAQVGLLAAGAGEGEIAQAIERLLDRDVVTPEPTDEECSRYYALHSEEFTSGERVFARHILFAVTPGAPVALIRAQAEKTLEQLRREPSRFAELAASCSNCPSAAQGGDLGQLGRGECVPEFEQALFAGRGTGVLPQLVNTRFGFHVVAIDQRVPGQRVPYDSVRERIAAQLYAAAQETALRQYAQRLAFEAGVEVPGLQSAHSPLVQ
jgi:peptidyl-prolyl cis-trans isomerase C